MEKKQNLYDDGNIPDIDLPRDIAKNSGKDKTQSKSQSKAPNYENVEPLPESSRPRQDGPGGA